jgi:hypothetical protein
VHVNDRMYSPEIRVLSVRLVHVSKFLCLGFDLVGRKLELGHEPGLLLVPPDVVCPPCQDDTELNTDTGGDDGGACEW